LAAKCLEVVLHRLKHQGPHRVLKHLAWLVARCPSPAMQEKLSYLQKREAHMQHPTYQQAGWPIGSGSVESANKVVVEARPKGAGMRLPSAERQPHARASQCGLQSLVARDLGDVSGSSTSASHESATSRQKASTGKRLWCLVFWRVRMYRLSHPPVHVATSPTAEALEEQPACRLGAGYSWRKPFLRRPPSTLVRTGETCAKK
jgi:hypothetical protein